MCVPSDRREALFKGELHVGSSCHGGQPSPAKFLKSLNAYLTLIFVNAISKTVGHYLVLVNDAGSKAMLEKLLLGAPVQSYLESEMLGNLDGITIQDTLIDLMNTESLWEDALPINLHFFAEVVHPVHFKGRSQREDLWKARHPFVAADVKEKDSLTLPVLVPVLNIVLEPVLHPCIELSITWIPRQKESL